jgi:hypothetical protein
LFALTDRKGKLSLRNRREKGRKVFQATNFSLISLSQITLKGGGENAIYALRASSVIIKTFYQPPMLFVKR